MRRTLLFSVCAALAASPWLLVAPAAQAAGNDCVGVQIGQTFSAGLNVPSGQLCSLRGGSVIGNVTVQSGAALVASSATIRGSINAQGATVQLLRTSVGGNFVSSAPANYQVPNDGSLKKVFVCGSDVGGDVAVSNAPGFGSIEFGGPSCVNNGGGNTMHSNMTDINNKTTSANHIVANNQIENDLYCSANTPAPTGSGNSARVKAGQCASL